MGSPVVAHGVAQAALAKTMVATVADSMGIVITVADIYSVMFDSNMYCTTPLKPWPTLLSDEEQPSSLRSSR